MTIKQQAEIVSPASLISDAQAEKLGSQKQLTQAVFGGLPPEYRWAAVDENGSAWAYEDNPSLCDDCFSRVSGSADAIKLGYGCDATDWQNSKIERLSDTCIDDMAIPNFQEQARKEAARQVEATLAERQNQYGDFSKVAGVSQHLQSVIAAAGADFDDVQREAMQMICSKLARLACGDANHVDSWHDIAGYATLVVRDLEGGK